MNKRLMTIISSVAVASTLLAGCNASSSTQSGGAGNSGSANEIKVGLNYELSGAVATYGQATVEGIELAFEEINAAGGVGGKKIVPVKVDNKSDVAESTNVATRLATQDKVSILLGPATSGSVKAASPVAMQNKVPLISASATADDVTVDAKGVKDFIFRICYSDSFQGTAVANFAQKSMKSQKAVLLVDNASDYSKGLAKFFTETYKKNNGTIVAQEAFVAGDKDYKAVLTKIKALDFDALFIPAYYQDVGLIIKQARELGINQPIYGADGYESPTLVDLAGATALNNVYFSNHYSPQDTDPAVTKFKAAFAKKYSKDPNSFSALGYDLAYFAADAAKRANSSDSVKIKEAIAATKDFAGITGKLSIDANHNPIKAITVLELKNGVQTFKEKIQP